MAQVILTAVGTALGGPIGGALGHVLGSTIDRTLINSVSPARQLGQRLTGLKLTQAREGEAIPQVLGRGRVAGTVIWAARLKENRTTTRTPKNGPKSETYSYSLSFAIGLCEGPIDGIGRIWADGQLLDQSLINYRLYRGTDNQTPDALIEAIEGDAPAYRGLSYMVFEDLNITPFGNRPPNLSVEVFCRPRGPFDDVEDLIDGVCLIPGAGEFVYATKPNAVLSGLSGGRFETQNTSDGRTDFVVALDQLQASLPNVRHVNLVISWFGNDLRCGHCQIKPGVEQAEKRTTPRTWSVSGLSRDQAYLISSHDGRPVYGGTPDDETVVAAIQELTRRGLEVTLIPFILMDIPAGNGLPDPYGASEQAAFPWRGRITCDIAPGREGSEDQTSAVADQVAAFMGEASAADFQISANNIAYSGSDSWGFRRFVLHVAALGVQAGGVAGVLLGSELRGLTTLRSDAVTYPAVAALKALASEVRSLVGPGTTISYGADWSEYFGHQPADGSADISFHLDPLWSDDHIDYVGIDWYAPLTDWRDGEAHADYLSGYKSIIDPQYLASRINGAEGYDWYYASDADRNAQIRTPITDGAYGEPWVFRPKDIINWWSHPHHDRPGGVRLATPTDWVPQSKPIRLIEYGCAAIDKGANAPNLFLDPKSSESQLPPYSSGQRDDAMQAAYIAALIKYYLDPAHNPNSTVYGGPMVEGMNVWAWDARPYPYFPQRDDLWGDADNWRTGHWLNGRVGAGSAKNLIVHLCAQAGINIDDLDVREVEGRIEGYVIDQVMTAADALSPVLGYLGLEVAERSDKLSFIGTKHGYDHSLALSDLALPDDAARSGRLMRRELMDVPASLVLRCYDLDHDYQIQAIHARRDDVAGASQMGLDLALALSAPQAQAYAKHSLERVQTLRQSLTLDLEPLDLLRLEVGDGLTIEGDGQPYRLVRIDQGERPQARLEPAPLARVIPYTERMGGGETIAPVLITGFDLLDLPHLGEMGDVRPVMIATATPFVGVDAYVGAEASDLRFRGRIEQAASVGELVAALAPARGNYFLKSAIIDVRLEGESPSSLGMSALRAGDNRLCIKALNGEWEVMQFQTATLVAPEIWRLGGLIRGQWGTDAARLAGAEAGAKVVLLPPEPVLAELSLSELGMTRLWRAGRAGFGGLMESAFEIDYVWRGVGLRPRAPVHCRVRRNADLSLALSWKGCARFGGDGWDAEPPLGEAAEAYRLRFCQADEVRREVEVTAAAYLYDVAMQATDFPAGFDAHSQLWIAQLSATVGAGLELRLGLAG